jgi:exopolyphosphatase/guanosine-5'-triphosphate,3'-diphosphate pyrophosphatase
MENNMVKIASLDLGSNSTRLLIADVSEEKFNTLERSHVVTKMAEGLEENGFISDEARKRVIKTLKTFLKQIKKHEVVEVFAVGTAAMRDSSNTDEFIDEIKRKLDIEVEIITGQQEGIITSLGVHHFMDNLQNYLIVDIGGRSTEFIYEDNNKVVSHSLDLGVVTLTEKYFSELPANRENILKAEQEVIEKISNLKISNNKLLIGVSGTATSLGSIYLEQDRFNEDPIHNIEIRQLELTNIKNIVQKLSEPEIITKFNGVDPKRAKTITSGIVILENIMKRYENSSIIISKNDILEGLILKKY